MSPSNQLHSTSGDPLVKKPFYHTDGLTYCEKDYLDTLEKCDVCEEHIKERVRCHGNVV